MARLRSLEEMKQRVTGDIGTLNARLLRVSRRLEREARRHPAIRAVPGRILISMFRKAVNTFEAMELLKKKRFIEEAWVLLRVLLETHVNVVYFWVHDPEEMVYRYLDASLLDKLKHLREVDFYEGTSLAASIDRKDWEAKEAEIKSRYSEAELKALRRDGFTGLKFQQRAKAVGLEDLYVYTYRIASRSVHIFDPVETPVWKSLGRRRRVDLITARREQLDANQNMLLGRLAYFMSEFIDSTEGPELILLGLGYEKWRDRARTLERPTTAEGTAPDDDGDRVRIWRM